MFGNHFYHATMRKSVAVFGTLFNNISVIRQDGSGNVLNQIKVPLAYGPKQKWLARIDQQTEESMAIKLPRMAFEITSITSDLNQKLSKRTSIIESTDDPTQKRTIKQIAAYDIGMQLNIMAKNQDDGLQILEQILPYFQPEYTVSVKPVTGYDFKQDVPVILTGVNITDDYEGDLTTRRVLVYTLDFTMKVKFFGPTSNQGVIREINIDFNNNISGTEILEEMQLTIDPPTADQNDDYTINVTIT